MMDKLVFEIQRLYPQIYLACHVDHVRASSTSWRLSSRDAAILAHLDLHKGIRPRSLAAHLSIGSSSLSSALERLAGLGYLVNVPKVEDKRCREIFLTERGAKAIAETSVLDAGRLQQVLENLSCVEREAVLSGLTLLVRAALELTEEGNK